MLVSWQFEKLEDVRETCIGHFNATTKSLSVLYQLGKSVEAVQATVDSSSKLLAYVVKDYYSENVGDDTVVKAHYKAYLRNISTAENEGDIALLESPSERQVLTQFIWRSSHRHQAQSQQIKLLVLTHGYSKYISGIYGVNIYIDITCRYYTNYYYCEGRQLCRREPCSNVVFRF